MHWTLRKLIIGWVAVHNSEISYNEIFKWLLKQTPLLKYLFYKGDNLAAESEISQIQIITLKSESIPAVTLPTLFQLNNDFTLNHFDILFKHKTNIKPKHPDIILA